MKKTPSLNAKDSALFRKLMRGTREIKQDTIIHRSQRKKTLAIPERQLIQEQIDASYYFSDTFQPLLSTEGPTVPKAQRAMCVRTSATMN